MKENSDDSRNPRRPRPRFSWLLAFAVLLAACGLCTAPQEKVTDDAEALKKSAPKIFISCDECDIDYIRTEITFVNYVRDRMEAGVHVLVTRQRTASGGWEYTLTFMGQNEFAGVSDTHKFFTNQSDSDDQVRRQVVHALKLGLTRYVARTPIAGRINLSFREEESKEEKKDRWHHWLFSLSANGFFSGEESYRSSSISGNFTANHVTEDWKLRISLGLNRNTSVFEYEGEEIESSSRSKTCQVISVMGINDHWSIGGYASVYSSTYSNVRRGWLLAPAVEYNLFPYSQSSRRQLRFLYKLGFQPMRYYEETIYEKTGENLFSQMLEITLELKEKWGTISTALWGSHYLHEFAKNRLELNSEISLNIFKGLSFNVWGGVALIHDQLSLPKAGATLEEVLLQRKQLATTYNYYASVGIRYTFGSIFTNVVNPRFGSLTGTSVSISM